jgi:uncharacterized repeat protein (TIGR01451 family)
MAGLARREAQAAGVYLSQFSAAFTFRLPSLRDNMRVTKHGFFRTDIMKTLSALAAAALLFSGVVHAQTAPAQTASPVTLTSDVKIERVEVDAAGKEKVSLYAPRQVVVVPGDKVLFTLEVTNTGAQPAAGFRATNPMPGPVQFVSVAEDWAEVSVDGGNMWGKLTSLKVKTAPADGTAAAERAADFADVTHVRWIFPDAIAPGGKRTISYRGVIK